MEQAKKSHALRNGLIIGGVFVALSASIFASFLIWKNVYDVAKSGGTVEFSAKAIGKTAYAEEKTVTIKDHQFTYYNVKSSDDGGWVLVDKTSYIINTDISFGFRYKQASLVSITKYGDASDDPRDMGEVDTYPGYRNYQVYGGFKLAIKESLDTNGEIDIGVLMHWC